MQAAESREIGTSRLRLRPFGREDLDDLHRLWTDSHVRRFLWDDKIISREQAVEIIESSVDSFDRYGFGFWCIFPPDTLELIGFAGLRRFGDPPEVELLYGIAPSHCGRGLATEAATAMIDYAFRRVGLEIIFARADAPNAASTRVMQKCGMKFLSRGIVDGLDTITYVLQAPRKL